jgi:iron complex outermembrane receptor protein
VGLKSNLLDNTLQLNLAAFTYELLNGHFNRTIPIPTPPFFLSVLENAAAQEGDGVEIDMLWQPSEELRVRAAGTFLDSKFTSLSAVNPIDPLVPYSPDPTIIPPRDLAGFDTRNSPDFQGSINVAYDTPLGNGALLTWSGNISYKGSQFYNEFNDPRLGADSYTILDGYIRYTPGAGNWAVTAWIKNATDELVVAGAFPISTSRTISGRYLPPRRYGVTVDFGFD